MIDLAVLGLVLAIVAGALGVFLLRKRRKKSARIRSRIEDDYAPNLVWANKPSQINLSCFVYFDVERNGTYDIADRPMGGIVGRLKRDQSVLDAVRSNSAGFINFVAAAGSSHAPINRPGAYEFSISVPPGWKVTSGNSVQHREIFPAPGSISGLAAESMLVPIGLAPDRYVEGTFGADASGTIAVFRGADQVSSETVSGEFRVALPDGATEIRISLPQEEVSVPVGPYPVFLGKVDASARQSSPRLIEKISFDGVANLGLRKVPSGYAGLNWFNLNALRSDVYADAQGYINGSTSGSHVAYTSSGHYAEIWRDSPFDLIGMSLSIAWLKAEGETGIVEIWRGAELVRRDALRLSALTPISYLPMIADVTKVRLLTTHSWQMILGDITVAR